MKQNISLFSLAAVLLLLLSSWGFTGHSKISERTAIALDGKIKGIDQWITFIAEHSSDADYRKSWDNTENPKHYIDIDNYAEFNSTGRIHESYDSLLAIYGRSFILDQGILPWTTLTVFDSLQNCFERKDWDKAKMWAADLSHYVGDGHMPLHITKNYDGQLSGNKGIHSRYESKMISSYVGQISGDIKSAEYISKVSSFVFNYLYQSNGYCDSILKADNLATKEAGSTSSSTYLASLWQNTGELTKSLFNDASYSLGSLIYTAWVDAGSPDFESTETKADTYNITVESLFPNPADTMLSFQYSIKTKGTYNIEIRDAEGKLVRKVESGKKKSGNYSLDIDASSLTKGAYLLVIHSSDFASTSRFIKR